MKKVLSLLILVLFLCSCSATPNNNETQYCESGIWISYYEINSMLKSEKGFKAEFENVIENCKKLQIQNLYIHTRAFGDSLYTSDYFPLMAGVKDYDYDVFAYIIEKCHKENMLVHAWINPYRVSTATVNIDEIDKNSPAYKWLHDENTDNDLGVCFSNGIYFNPASQEVRRLVLDGIRELVAKYSVDGIHFDDYFYPTTKTDFDTASYNQYKTSCEKPLSLAAWRRENVNLLISSCYEVIKYANKDIVFSISPAASIESNFNNLYADVTEWIEKGYVDEIIPQLYFGFEYPDEEFRFENLLSVWKKAASSNKNVKLKIGLANYKAKPSLEADKAEWENNSDIIARQIAICENDNEISGYVLFSYSSVFGEEAEFREQREKIIEYLKSGEENE